jgi:ribosomal-protein-alanine N-acetyltransferase
MAPSLTQAFHAVEGEPQDFVRTIESERLRLVPVTTENADDLWDVLQMPDLREYQDLPESDRAHFRKLVGMRPTSLEPGASGRFEWLIYLAGIEAPVGWASLRVGDRAASAEIGYSVLAEYRRRGIATETVDVLLREAFEFAKLRKVRAYCVPENEGSRRVLERLGFDEDGVLPRGATVQGRPVDVMGFVMERARWAALRVS